MIKIRLSCAIYCALLLYAFQWHMCNFLLTPFARWCNIAQLLSFLKFLPPLSICFIFIHSKVFAHIWLFSFDTKACYTLQGVCIFYLFTWSWHSHFFCPTHSTNSPRSFRASISTVSQRPSQSTLKPASISKKVAIL